MAVGETSALLIDTGAGGVNLRQAVREVTDLPVRIVNTHAHYDHISGNGAFDMRFAHPYEIAAIEQAGYAAQPVSDGNGFDLGGSILQAISLPGHSPGGLGLWDADRGLLFAGDTLAHGRPVFLSLQGASTEAYLRSLDRLIALAETTDEGRLERFFCAHGDVECGLDTVRALRALTQAVLDGVAERKELPQAYRPSLGDDVQIAIGNGVSLLVR